MKRQAGKELASALEKELKACGCPTAEESQQLFRAMRKGRIPPKTRKLSEEQRFMLGLLAPVILTLMRRMEKWKPKSQAEFDEALKQIEGLRYKMRALLPKVFATLKKAFPQKKRGPRPRLTDAEKQSACNTIDALKLSGMTTKFAIGQIAKQHQVTPRTMRRVWESHARN